ncbi:MAG: hypothetical protein KC503_42995 [Myxococcales bacterium]|nr:hypothetical protein [Myxococcales bacterium]
MRQLLIFAALAVVMAAALPFGCGKDQPTINCTIRSDCSDPRQRCSEGVCVAAQCEKPDDCGAAADHDCLDGACLKHCKDEDIGKGCQTHGGEIGLCAPSSSGAAQCYPSCAVGKTCAFPFTRCEGTSKLCDLPAGW